MRRTFVIYIEDSGTEPDDLPDAYEIKDAIDADWPDEEVSVIQLEDGHTIPSGPLPAAEAC